MPKGPRGEKRPADPFGSRKSQGPKRKPHLGGAKFAACVGRNWDSPGIGGSRWGPPSY
jgi:hypothetical protein